MALDCQSQTMNLQQMLPVAVPVQGVPTLPSVFGSLLPVTRRPFLVILTPIFVGWSDWSMLKKTTTPFWKRGGSGKSLFKNVSAPDCLPGWTQKQLLWHNWEVSHNSVGVRSQAVGTVTKVLPLNASNGETMVPVHHL